MRCIIAVGKSDEWIIYCMWQAMRVELANCMPTLFWKLGW